MADLQVKIDDTLRDNAQAVAASMGLDLASAVRVFLAQMVRENGFPFLPKADPFYLEAGMTVTKTMAELEGMVE